MEVVLKTERILDGEPCAFKGTIKVNMPLHHERSKLFMGNLKELTMAEQAASNESEALEAKVDKARAMLDLQSAMSAKVYEYVIGCLLTSDDGTVLKTKEELWSHPDAAPLVDALIGKFMSNFAGNGKGNSSGRS